MNVYKKFIAIDGPNGVGKSTLIESLKQKFSGYDFDFVFTKEPTTSTLGNFIRENQNSYRAHSLAALVTADRYAHIDLVLKPGLERNNVIITDRYIASSLVYQILDKLTYDFVLNLNSQIILPGLYFILTADVEILQQRLQSRHKQTRFESNEFSLEEVKLFVEAGKILDAKGVEVQFVNNASKSIEVTASNLVTEIVNYLNR